MMIIHTRKNRRCVAEVGKRGNIVATRQTTYRGGTKFATQYVLLYSKKHGWEIAHLPQYDFAKDRQGGARNYPEFKAIAPDGALEFLQGTYPNYLQVVGIQTLAERTLQSFCDVILRFDPGREARALIEKALTSASAEVSYWILYEFKGEWKRKEKLFISALTSPEEALAHYHRYRWADASHLRLGKYVGDGLSEVVAESHCDW